MAQLPRFDPAEVATKSDLAVLRAEVKDLCAELRAEIPDGLGAVNQRFDASPSSSGCSGRSSR